MKSGSILMLFFLLFAGFANGENSPYKINDSEIDLLFSQSDEVLVFNVFANGMMSQFPAGQFAKADDDKKIIAGVLALTFLGAFGVHRYYLGHVKAGVIGYLLPSFCFGLGWIPAIVDGVLYLTATDEEFKKKYRDNQKIWVWL